MSFEFVKETGKPINYVDIGSKLIEFGKKPAKKASRDKNQVYCEFSIKFYRICLGINMTKYLINVLEYVNGDSEFGSKTTVTCLFSIYVG